ncbi:MAG: DUF5714 domain-containing protein [Methanocorpusculum sp.]|nr:DUF5714 domain-containing protein [Methanocorpusculum sp.]
MNFSIAECRNCGETMIQDYVPVQTECDICGKDIITNFVCPNGHHMCNDCRYEGVLDDIKRICMHTKSKNPVSIAVEVMATTKLSLIGCKHYLLSPISIYTAYKNAGGKVNDFEGTLEKIYNRVMTIQTSQCRLGNVCGIPSSIGGAFQAANVENKAIYEINKIANDISGLCMTKLMNPNWNGSRDCCIRNALICTAVTAKYLNNYYWIELELPSEIKCRFSEGNPRCNKEKCSVYNGIKLDKLQRVK